MDNTEIQELVMSVLSTYGPDIAQASGANQGQTGNDFAKILQSKMNQGISGGHQQQRGGFRGGYNNYNRGYGGNKYEGGHQQMAQMQMGGVN